MDKKNIAIVVVALVVIAGIYFAVTRKPVMTEPSPMGDAMMKKDEAPDAMMDSGKDSAENNAMDKSEPMKDDGKMMAAGTYEDYSADKVALADQKDNKVVLFFHADWCPICRAIDAEINASKTALPAGVHLLKVDFDTATALRQKYGVTSQYTFVQVDGKGNVLKKWSASSLAQVLSPII